MIVVTDRGQAEDVVVTQAELDRYTHEYNNAFTYYYGVPPTLEEYIRSRQAGATPAIKDSAVYKKDNILLG